MILVYHLENPNYKSTCCRRKDLKDRLFAFEYIKYSALENWNMLGEDYGQLAMELGCCRTKPTFVEITINLSSIH